MVSQNVKGLRVIVIVGATASGKSALAHWLADAFRTELKREAVLINLDAFQIYKGFDLGTAKPTVVEREAYRYEMIDLIEPSEGLDAREFARRATDACQEAFANGSIPIAVGGSGLYLRAFLHGLDDFPERSDGLRNFIRAYAKRWGWPALHAWLEKLDAVRASELHPNDKTRIERALEIIWLSGKKVSESRSQTEVLKNQTERFESFVIHVDGSDEFIKHRVAKRTQTLLKSGWVEEVKALSQTFGEERLKELPAMRAIGYSEILESLIRAPQLSSQSDALEQALITKTWQYARRQRTWNAKEKCDAQFSWERENCAQLFYLLTNFFT